MPWFRMYELLDKFFIVFHSLIILFNLFGWIWKKTRKPNLVLLLLTGGSWFILGIWYGIGYCPLTDLHWMVLKKLGEKELPSSYVQYLLERILNIKINEGLLDFLIVSLFFTALVCSIIMNILDYRKKHGN